MGPCYVVKVIVQVIFTESEVEVKVTLKSMVKVIVKVTFKSMVKVMVKVKPLRIV